MQFKTSSKNGFSKLSALLVVLSLLVLTRVVVFTVNQQKLLRDARASQRKADVNLLISSVTQYMSDNKDTLPGANIPTAPTAALEICSSTVSATCTTAKLADLSSLTANQAYLSEIPVDPAGNSTDGSGYTIQKAADGKIVVSAPAIGKYGSYTVTK